MERMVEIVLDYAEMTDWEMLDLVQRRRRQLHVHSVAYYHYDLSFIDDTTFDLWSKELAEIYAAFPSLVTMGVKADIFTDWTGETGMHLPVTDDTLRVINSLRQRKENCGLH